MSGCTSRARGESASGDNPQTATVTAPPPNQPAAANTTTRAYDAFACTDKPTVYVFGSSASGLRTALTSGGFEVATLPLDRSPAELRGMILLPAFASEDSAYAAYMAQHATDLYTFVDRANVLVQLAQAKEREEVPPFLPMTHTATRGDAHFDSVRVTDPNHPLVANFDTTDGLLSFQESDLVVSAFASQDGFDVILADETSRYPALMEGAYGQGRIVLAALSFDYQGVRGAALSQVFFNNLLGHVQNVCARTTPALDITSSNTQESFTAGSQMLAVMPDTQVYSLRLPGLLMAQMSWIREKAHELDIRYALQLGDITNNNTRIEWERASAAFGLLGDVPYAVVTGNHDYGPSGDASTRETLLNEYFPFEPRAAAPGFGGAYERGKLDNTYHLFSIGGREVILLALEWGPRDEVIAWANKIMSRHPHCDGILATHAYLNHTSLRYDHNDTVNPQNFNPHEYSTPGGVNDGEELWQKLVRHHRFIMTLNGHVIGDGVGYLASKTARGNTCHQMLSNYQMRVQGGEGYLRLIEFLPDGRSVRVFTYSALYDKFLDEPDQNFDLVLD